MAPYFTYGNANITGKSFYLNEGETINKFACKAAHSSSKLTVECLTLIRNVTNSTLEDTLPFDLSFMKVDQTASCECKNGEDVAKFFFHRNSKSAALKFEPRQISNTYIIFIIAMAFVVMILAVLLLGTLMFVFQKRSELYTYFYSKGQYTANDTSTQFDRNGLRLSEGLYSIVSSRLSRTQTQIAIEEETIFRETRNPPPLKTTRPTVHSFKNNSRCPHETNTTPLYENTSFQIAFRRLTNPDAIFWARRSNTVGESSCSTSTKFLQTFNSAETRHVQPKPQVHRKAATVNKRPVYANLKPMHLPKPCNIPKAKAGPVVHNTCMTAKKPLLPPKRFVVVDVELPTTEAANGPPSRSYLQLI
jgi:hypothetical protein